MSVSKRSRSVNFTKEEKLLLIKEVYKYKSIIKYKTTNKLNWNEKLAPSNEYFSENEPPSELTTTLQLHQNSDEPNPELSTGIDDNVDNAVYPILTPVIYSDIITSAGLELSSDENSNIGKVVQENFNPEPSTNTVTPGKNCASVFTTDSNNDSIPSSSSTDLKRSPAEKIYPGLTRIRKRIADFSKNKCQENAWKKIVANFNAKNFHKRTLDQVRAKYDNIKSTARKEVAKLRCYQGGTGGGLCTSFHLDTSTDAVLDLMNVTGLNAEFDSDSIEINKILIVEESSTISKDEFEHSDNNTDSKITLEVLEQDSPRKNWNKYVREK
ncbi:unnamed protein product [Diabrotica balteata]|uniref:Regulatory protein zeste n=1 Tax=Diabrotica balteata TaxID=107213 RepID=A0A9N9XIK1_DIABA|nr:unnamed protein product [Diabrotica balteata]